MACPKCFGGGFRLGVKLDLREMVETEPFHYVIPERLVITGCCRKKRKKAKGPQFTMKKDDRKIIPVVKKELESKQLGLF